MNHYQTPIFIGVYVRATTFEDACWFLHTRVASVIIWYLVGRIHPGLFIPGSFGFPKVWTISSPCQGAVRSWSLLVRSGPSALVSEPTAYSYAAWLLIAQSASFAALRVFQQFTQFVDGQK